VNAPARPPQAQHLAKATRLSTLRSTRCRSGGRCPECGADVRLSRKEARARADRDSRGRASGGGPRSHSPDKARRSRLVGPGGSTCRPRTSSPSTSPPSVQDRVLPGLGLLAALSVSALACSPRTGHSVGSRPARFRGRLDCAAIAEVDLCCLSPQCFLRKMRPATRRLVPNNGVQTHNAAHWR